MTIHRVCTHNADVPVNTSIGRPTTKNLVTAASEAALLSLMTNYTWRGEFTNDEINALHAQAFETRIFTDDEWDWEELVGSHSLGWVVAREDDVLVGFVNVVWDGFVHAWLQDTMVSATAR